MGSALLVLDHAHLRFPLPLKSHAYLDSATLLLDFAHLELLLFPRSLSKTGSAALVSGLTCAGLVFALLVTDSSHLDLSMPTQSFARFEFLLPAVGFTHSDLFLLLQSCSHYGFAALIFGIA